MNGHGTVTLTLTRSTACCMWNGGLHEEVRIPPCQIKRCGALNSIRRGCQGLALRGISKRKLEVWAMAPQTSQKAAVTVITTTGPPSMLLAGLT